MSVITLKVYMNLCRLYNWTPTWDGLKSFARYNCCIILRGFKKL